MSNARYNCSGGVTYGDHYFHCWIAEKGGQHGTLGLTDAIKVSCDSFFYQYGNAAGIDAIDQTGDALGLGKETGIHLTGEQPGIMPGPEWMAIHYPRERWSQAYTANVSIGQGYVLASPLQMAMAYATVANGGVSYYPRLVSKILNQDGSIAMDENGKPAVSSAPRVDADLRLDFTQDQIDLVRKGLWDVVNEDGGTGGRARLKDVQVAGKTGTAQASTNGKKDTIAWFCCFAPFDHPKYVVVAMVQGGEHGGSVAAPIATRILERTLGMDAGTFEPQVAWLAPAHHPNPFAMVKDVTFKDTEANVSTDEEHGDDSQTADTQMAGAGGDPDVEQAPDAEGRVATRQTRVARAQPVTPPPERRGFFQRLFGRRSTPAPAPAPTPSRRPRGY
jgi:penicillin-binding protein 2